MRLTIIEPSALPPRACWPTARCRDRVEHRAPVESGRGAGAEHFLVAIELTPVGPAVPSVLRLPGAGEHLPRRVERPAVEPEQLAGRDPDARVVERGQELLQE